MTNEFEFKVRFHKGEPDYLKGREGWAVSLPHQCDRWEISGSMWGPVTQEKAIEDLKTFIEEAQQALAALEKSEQHNLSPYDIKNDRDIDARSA